MRYYIGREIGFDDMGADAVEYIVYEMKALQCSKDHIRDVFVKRGCFNTLDEAVKFFRDCYDGKIQTKSTKAPGVEIRKVD